MSLSKRRPFCVDLNVFLNETSDIPTSNVNVVCGHRICSLIWDTTLQLVFFRLGMILIYLNLTTASKMFIAKHVTVAS